MHELVSHRDYVNRQELSFWRSASGYEVDFILGDHTAVELKAKATVSPRDLRSLRALEEEGLMKRLLCVSLEQRARRVGNIEVLPLADFLDRLWGGGLTWERGRIPRFFRLIPQLEWGCLPQKESGDGGFRPALYTTC